MPTNPFASVDINPSTFFEKAGNYASQGRFQFSLDISKLIAPGGILGPAAARIISTPGTRPLPLPGEVEILGDLFDDPALADGPAGQESRYQAYNLLSKGLLAKTASVPASTLATYEEFSFSGPTRKHVHSQLFGPLNIEFLLMGSSPTEAAVIHSTFMEWHEKIVSPSNATTVDKVPESDVTAFEVEYYDNYKCDRADLKVLSSHGIGSSTGGHATSAESQVILSMSFHEIYPIAVGGLSLSWDNEDAPLVLPVTFEYYYMKTHKQTGNLST